MKRIYKAINEGLKSLLIDFGNNKIEKSNHIDSLNNYKLGDYVYYDKEIGYNLYKGKTVALCVNEDPSLFLVIDKNKSFYTSYFQWAIDDSNLDKDNIPDFGNGWDNTLYIKTHYRSELKNTVWAKLKKNEYIPSYDEMLLIVNNVAWGKDLFEDFYNITGHSPVLLGTSSLYINNLSKYEDTKYLKMKSVSPDYTEDAIYKFDNSNFIKLLHI